MITQTITPPTPITIILSFLCPRTILKIIHLYTVTSTAQEIENIILSLKAKDSCGYDEISMWILKLSSHLISSPTNFVCNRILSTGKFLGRLKYSYSRIEKNSIWVRALAGPMHLALKTGHLCPIL